jgi:hypothetical protein
MLQSHMEALEANLLSQSGVAAQAGHKLHRGTPREVFIQEFLSNHLSDRVSIGTGEIIDARSRPREDRNQIDIVVYKGDYPRLRLGGDINAFLVESVVATIEVKSLLTQDELKVAVNAAHNVKSLNRHPSSGDQVLFGYQPPSILSYVVAYDGPASMKTISGWLGPIHRDLGINEPAMPLTGAERAKVVSPSLDGIFLLGKGFIQFDNSPLGFLTDEIRMQRPNARWVGADTERGSLLLLFMLLTQAVSGVSLISPDFRGYLSGFGVPGIFLQP